MSNMTSLFLFLLFDNARNFDRKGAVKNTARWSDIPLLTEWKTEEKRNSLVHRTSRCCGAHRIP